MQTTANDERWKHQVSLLATRQQIQDEIKTIRELAAQNATELDDAASSDPAERMKALNSQLMAAQTRKTEAQNSLAGSKYNVKRFNTRLAGMEKQASDRPNRRRSVERHRNVPPAPLVASGTIALSVAAQAAIAPHFQVSAFRISAFSAAFSYSSSDGNFINARLA